MDNQASKSVVKVSLMCKNSDSFTIHFVVVFVDMAGDLGVMVEQTPENSPFVFCDPSFQ